MPKTFRLPLFCTLILSVLFVNQAFASVQDDFIQAAKEGNLRLVRELYTQGVDIDKKGTKKYSALYIATARGQKNVVAFLLSHEAEVNSRNSHGYTPLMAASERGWEDIVLQMIAKGANVNAKTNTAVTVLSQSTRAANANVFRILIENGADIDPFTINAVLTRGNKKMVEILLTNGIEAASNVPHSPPSPVTESTGRTMSMTGGVGKSPSLPAKREPKSLLHAAIQAKKEETALLLIERGASTEEKPKSKEDTANPLFVMALERSMFAVAKILIEKGADVDGLKSSYPLISYLIDRNRPQRNYIESIRFLLDNGADIEKRPVRRKGATPLIWAAARGDKAIVELLLAYGADLNSQWIDPPGYGSSYEGMTALSFACRNSKNDVVQLLLEKGAAVNTTSSIGNSALYYATANKKGIASAQLLLDHGFNPNQTRKDFRSNYKDDISPLRDALLFENLEVADLLLKYGADIKADNMKGTIVEVLQKVKIALLQAEKYKVNAEDIHNKLTSGEISKRVADSHLARAESAAADLAGKEKIVQFLIQSGAELNESKGGLSPLMAAAQMGHVDFLQLFVDNGSDLDLQNNSGDTALIKTAEAKQHTSITFLLGSGADSNITNNAGNTALIVAVEQDDIESTKILLAAAPDVNVTNNEGMSAYWYAKQNENKEMVALLKKHGASTFAYNAHVLKIKTLQAAGIVPGDVSPATMSPQMLKLTLMYIANQFGIDNPEEYQADKRLSSPEKTWELHKQAAIEGDFNLLQKTLAKPDHLLLKTFKSLSADKRKELVTEMNPIQQITRDKNKAQYRIRRMQKGQEITFYITFVKVFGEWRIEDY